MVEQISAFGNIDLMPEVEREQTLAEATLERNQLDEEVDVNSEAVREGIDNMVAATVSRFAAIGSRTDFLNRMADPARAEGINQLKADILGALAVATGEPNAGEWSDLGPESTWLLAHLEAGLTADGNGYSLGLLGADEALIQPPEVVAEVTNPIEFMTVERDALERMFSPELLAPIYEALEAGEGDSNYDRAMTVSTNLYRLRGVLTVLSNYENLDTLLNDPAFQVLDTLDGRLVRLQEFGLQENLLAQAGPETYEPSAELAERATEAAAFLESFSETFAAFRATTIGNAFPENFYDHITQTLTDPANEAQLNAALAFTDFFQSNAEVIGQIASGEDLPEGATEALEAAVTALRPTLEAIGANAPSGPGTVSPEVAAATTEQPLSPEARRMLDSVSDYMRNTYSQHFAEWQTALESGSMNPLQSFRDYLLAQPEYQTEFGRIALQISFLIEDLMPILEALGLDWFASEEETGTTTTEGPPAADVPPTGGETTPVPPEVLAERLSAFNTYFQSEGAPVIAEFSSEEDGDLAYDSEVANAFISEPSNADLTLEGIEELVEQVKAILSEDQQPIILQRGLRLGDLAAIADLPADLIEDINANGIKLNDVTGRVAFDENFVANLEDALRSSEEAATRVQTEVETMAEAGEINLNGIHIVSESGEPIDPELYHASVALMEEHPLAINVYDKGLSESAITNFNTVLANPEAVADGWITLRNHDVMLDSEGFDRRRSFPYRELNRSHLSGLFIDLLEEIQAEISS